MIFLSLSDNITNISTRFAERPGGMAQNPILLWDIFIQAKKDFLTRINVFSPSIYPFKSYFVALSNKCKDIDVKIFQTRSSDEASRLFLEIVFSGLPPFDKCSESSMNDPFFQICDCFRKFLKSFLAFASIVLKVNDATTRLLDVLAGIELIRKNREEQFLREQRAKEEFLANQRAIRIKKNGPIEDLRMNYPERAALIETKEEGVSALEKLANKISFRVPPLTIDPPKEVIQKAPKIRTTNLNPNATEYYPQYLSSPAMPSPAFIMLGPIPEYEEIQNDPKIESPRKYNIVFGSNVKNIKT